MQSGRESYRVSKSSQSLTEGQPLLASPERAGPLPWVILPDPPWLAAEEVAAVAAEVFVPAADVAAAEVVGLTDAKTPPDFVAPVGPEAEELRVKVGKVSLELLTGGLPP